MTGRGSKLNAINNNDSEGCGILKPSNPHHKIIGMTQNAIKLTIRQAHPRAVRKAFAIDADVTDPNAEWHAAHQLHPAKRVIGSL
jgi:hypothetical protein